MQNAVRTVAEMKVAVEAERDVVSILPGGSPRVELTISGGTVTPATRDHGGNFTIDTESGAAADDLDTVSLTNIPDGALIWLHAENASRVVTLKHADGSTGEMLMRDGADFVLDALDKWVCFQRRGTTSLVEVDRSYGDEDVSSEWHRSGLTPTRVSDTQFTVPGDQTAILHAGRRIRTTDTAGTDYATITSSSYSDPNTTVNVVVDNSGALDSGLATLSYGQLSQDTPSFTPAKLGGLVALDTLSSYTLPVPAWATEVVISLDEASSTGTAISFFRMVDAGGPESTGYKGAGQGLGVSTNSYALGSAIFIANTELATDEFSGQVRFVLMDRATNLWSYSGVIADEPNDNVNLFAGSKALSGPLTGIQFHPGGSETFDGGSLGSLIS